MDRNAIIGFGLIFLLILAWQRFTRPTEAELAEQERIQDSIRMAQEIDTTTTNVDLLTEDFKEDTSAFTQAVSSDSVKQALMMQSFGAFAPAATGEEQTFTLENDLLKLVISNKGGQIKEVELKEYSRITENEKHEEVKSPLKLLEDEKNKFEYLIPVPGAANKIVKTSDLYFTAQQEGQGLVLRASAGNGRYFEQRYSLEDGTYNIGYAITTKGLNQIVDPTQSTMTLNWVNHLTKLEKNVMYERNYSTIYYKPAEEDVEHCSCTGNDLEEIEGEPLRWISHSNQFFNSTLIAESAFPAAKLETLVYDEEAEDLKRLESLIEVPLSGEQTFAMDMYVGPNEFKTLQAYDLEMEYIIPFGRSILGTINRWVVRPIFTFFSSFIGSMGIVILLLTILIKLVLYPLSYRMLYSQAKMGALKPQLSGLKEKFKGDSQKVQAETMKLYQENGVNPLGGCLPVLFQMPIWIALYRFFPASIEFRQESFLWASDLSSYDVAFTLPFTVPFYGDHVSLFTLLWAGTTVIYTYFNTQQMDMGGTNPAMKYMQYFMPVMFLFFFNNYASGLTCYLLFSNIFNIAQTIVTKNYIINHDKIRREMEAHKKKPKKKGGFQSRLQDALKEQQRVQEERAKSGKKGRKK
ncbi:MAG: membrane protein insertase YidC [Bacteroidetes bacterium]|nr:membrane protein insertase YidC [Bacteroidota bacterium]